MEARRGILLEEGAKILLSITPGGKESYEDRPSRFRDMVSRNLKAPLTVTGDGAPGLAEEAEAA